MGRGSREYDARAHRQAFVFLVFVGIIWGTIGIAGKLLYRHTDLDAVAVTWLRVLIASPIYVILAVRALGGNLFRATRRDLTLMVVFGVVLIFYQVCYLEAVARVGVSTATLIALCVPPVLVAVASIFVLGEHLTNRTASALVGSLIGTVLLVGWQSEVGEQSGSRVVGVFFAIGCAAGIACHVMGTRSIAARHHALRPLAIGFPTGVIALVPVLGGSQLTFDIPVSGWLLLLYLGIVPSVVGYWLYQRGLQYVTATTASIITLLEPLVAAILAWAIFNERLGVIGWIGGVLLMGSIVVLSMGTQRVVRQTAEDVALV